LGLPEIREAEEIVSISAMKEALEALDAYSWEQVDAARAALRQAIAEAEQPDLARVGEVGVWGDKREWVGLTNEEIVGLMALDGASLADFIQYIEAKLKEKNT